MNRGPRSWKILGMAAVAGLSLAGCALDEVGGLPPDGGTGDGGMAGDMFSMLYNSDTFQQCQGCHAPGAPGFDPTAGTEATQDWSTRDSAYMSLQGMASGLIGNFEGCNDVPFIGDTPETSLLVAAFDENVRLNFALDAFPDCNGDSISDMNLTLGSSISQAELDLLKQWIAAGAPDQ